MLSIRLSPGAISHLLESTSACAIIVSKRSQVTVRTAYEGLPQEKQKGLRLVECFPLQQLLQPTGPVAPDGLQRHIPSDRETAIILHSSGTTGLPKPIPLAHRYLLGYAACHRLGPAQCLGRRNVSTLPMYHVGTFTRCMNILDWR